MLYRLHGHRQHRQLTEVDWRTNGRTASLTLTGCTISGNTAVQGGGLDILHGLATLTGCTVGGNTARYGGGLGNYGNLGVPHSERLHG